MNYNFVCPFKDCVCIEMLLTSDPIDTEGSYVELFVTEEEGKITLYRYDSKTEQEDCISSQGTKSVLEDLVSSIRLYSRLKKEELTIVYERMLSYLINKILAQDWIKYLMREFKVNSTVDLIEIMLNKGKLDWLDD